MNSGMKRLCRTDLWVGWWRAGFEMNLWSFGCYDIKHELLSNYY